MYQFTSTIKKMMPLLLFAMVSIGAIAQQKPVEVYKLPNGLTVILQEDHRRPEVQGIVATRAGSVNESPDATGVAHYLEHVMFKGTTSLGTIDWTKEKPHYDKIIQLYDELGKTKDKKKREAIQKEINEESLKAAQYSIPNELSRLVDEMGGTGLNAGTSYDYTYYLSKFPSSQIERWLTLYSHLFEQPVYRAFQAELETIYEEYNMYSDNVQSRINNEVMSSLFKKTPYGRDIIGLPEHLKNPSLSELQKFYANFYVPENMALILCGDFNSEEAKRFVEQTFGKWVAQKTALPTFEEEAPFKGREFKEIKRGYQNIVSVYFRSTPVNHADNILLNACNALLSNGQSGFLDQLMFDNKVYQVGGYNLAFKNSGILTISAIPNPQEFYEGPPMNNITTMEEYKAVVRELDRAELKALSGTEKMIMEGIEQLKDGDFGDWQLESTKEMFITSFKRQQESVTSKAYMFANYFGNDIDHSMYDKYIDIVKNITKEDIIRTAKKYFDNNYLVIHIKPGSTKTTNIDKPEYKPLIFPAADEKSDFAKKFATIKTPEQKIDFIDFQKDVEKVAMTNGNTMYYTHNPVNNIFSMVIRYDIGRTSIKELDYIYLLNFAGAAARDAKGLKGQFARLNCDYTISANDNFVYVTLSGPEENLRQAATYLNLFINETTLSSNQTSRLYQGERSSRKYEKEEASVLSDALEDYILYGNKSDYIDRMPLKDVMSIKARELVTAFEIATEYTATLFYTGAKPAHEIKTLIEQTIKFAETPRKGQEYKEREKQIVKENTIYVINHSSLQSQISFFANGKPYDTKDAPLITAFNNYFSGGFTGLVLQEIREFRSLAYGAGASYSSPGLQGNPASFFGSIQTQDDKTAFAVDVFMDLLLNMPQKPDRLDILKNKLTLSSAITRPDFRQLGMAVDSWERLGYTEDPLKIALPVYKALKFEDIVTFEKDYIKNNPMAIMIVGPKRRIETKSLEKFGKIKELRLSDIFSKDE